MVRSLRLVFLFLVLASLPSLGLAQFGTPRKSVDPVKLKAKLLSGTSIEGHLTKIDSDEKRFTCRYTHEEKKPIPAEQQKLNQLNQQWQQALAKRSTSLDQLQKLQEQCRAAYKTAFDIDETNVDFELQGEKSLAVRTLIEPTDADGKTKKLTYAEKQKLKGDPRLPGYQATLKDIDSKTWVRVYIDKNKKPMPGDKASEPIYPLTMIVIVPAPKERDPFAIPGQ
jgi:hypothetical protein